MDRKLKPKAPDTRSIDIEDEYAVEFWTTEFKISQEKLKAAVLTAGTNAFDVKRALKK